MKKEEFVDKVAQKTGMNKKDAQQVVQVVFEMIAQAMAQGETVRITGFGTFGVKSRAGFQGRHPQSGEVLDIPASVLPTFEAAKQLKEKVNRSHATR